MEYSIQPAQNVLLSVSNVFHELCKETNCSDICQIKSEALAKLKHEDLAGCMFITLQRLKTCHEVLKSSTVEVEELKNKIISLQAEKIKSQEQLLEIKNETVETFQSTLKSEMKSYRDVCASSISTVPSPVITSKALSSVVKEVVSVEDRRKNIMLYGVKEDNSTEPDVAVSNVFDEIGEKPPVSNCVRVGKQNSSGRPRPIKVTLKSSEAAMKIQRKAKVLKNSPATSQVFIAPDRTREERAERRKLVVILKEKIRNNPSQHYYIAGKEVRSRGEMSGESKYNCNSSTVGNASSKKIVDAAKEDDRDSDNSECSDKSDCSSSSGLCHIPFTAKQQEAIKKLREMRMD